MSDFKDSAMIKALVDEKATELEELALKILPLYQRHKDEHDLVDFIACSGILFAMLTKDMDFVDKRRYLISQIEVLTKMLWRLCQNEDPEKSGTPTAPGLYN